MVAGFIERLCSLFRSERGSVAIQLALMSVVILGMVALGVEITLALYKHRQMQMFADAAAYGGAIALKKEQDPTLEANAIVAGMVAENNAGTVTVAVEEPKILKGPNAGKDGVAVTASQPLSLAIVGLVCSVYPDGCTGSTSVFNVGARAVAVITAEGSYCVTALNPSASPAVSASGGAIVNLTGCSLAVNSNDPTKSLSAVGGATINATTVVTNGGIDLSGGASINATDGVRDNAGETITDRLSGNAVPSATGRCSKTNYKLSGGKSDEIDGGCKFSNGISLSGGSALTLNNGVYIVNNGSLSLSGGSSLQGANVTIVLTGNSTVQFSGGSIVSIKAPTAGPTNGIAFFGRGSGTSDFTGGANQTITGTVYLPNQSVKYAGGSVTNPTKCMELIANTITFTGNAQFALDCSGMPVGTAGGGLVNLVE